MNKQAPSNLTDQGYWNTVWAPHKLSYDPKSVLFKEVFRETLTAHLKRGGSCFEVGCFPGQFLIYLAREFDLIANGIDLHAGTSTNLPPFLKSHGVKAGRIWEGDFFAQAIDQQFDLVASFGFLEHFLDTENVLARHANLVKPGGLLFLECPNFTRAQWLLRRLIDPENLRSHNIKSMNLDLWKNILQRHGFSILRQGYYRTFDFWTEPGIRTRFNGLSRLLCRVGPRLNSRLNLPNRFTSAFMYCVAKKSAA
jgi:cyclopropane fatty-acyl-phospholipid synthase-like methyltransferase